MNDVDSYALGLLEMASGLRSSNSTNALSMSAKRKRNPAPQAGLSRPLGGLEALHLVATETSVVSVPAQNGPKRFSLKLSPPPPRYPIVDSYFRVVVTLVDKKDNMKLNCPVPLSVDILYENGTPVGDQKVLELDGSPSIDGATGQSQPFNIRIRHTSMQHENKNFRLRFFAIGDPTVASSIDVLTSVPITVVRHRLQITEQPPGVWYKDEGGRDKCMTITAQLVDETGHVVHNREIPIRVALVYDGEGDVKNQTILKVINEAPPKVGRDGKVQVRCRIDEVSKNHQKQAFCIKIIPDTSHAPSAMDVSADTSKPVTVRSKRNKKPRTDKTPIPAPPSRDPAASPVGSPLVPTTVEVSGLGAMAQAVTPAQLPPNPVQKPDVVDSQDLLRLQQIGGSLNSIVTQVVSWCQFVIKELMGIEWQHVGFEVNEDGQVNYLRPLYRCPGCWVYKDIARPTHHLPHCMILRATTYYDMHIGMALQKLTKIAVQQSRGAPQRQTTSGPSSVMDTDGRIARTASVVNQEVSSSSGAQDSSLLPPPPSLAHILDGLDEHKQQDIPMGGFIRQESLDPPYANQLIGMAAHLDEFPSGQPLLSHQISAQVMELFDFERMNEEQNVAAILPQSFQTFGFPAMDNTSAVIGFYQPEQYTLVFFPLQRLKTEHKITDAQIAEVASFVQQPAHKNILETKHTHVTLEKLKEAVMLVSYQAQATSFQSHATTYASDTNY